MPKRTMTDKLQEVTFLVKRQRTNTEGLAFAARELSDGDAIEALLKSAQDALSAAINSLTAATMLTERREAGSHCCGLISYSCIATPVKELKK